MATTDDRLTTPDAAPGGPTLGRLSELDDYKVADGYPDIRGWTVKTRDGNALGKVNDLVVDTAAMRVRYVDVEVDRDAAARVGNAAAGAGGDDERHTLVPIGNVQLDDRHDDVLVDGYSLEQLVGLPRYGGGTITRDYERSLRDRALGGVGAGAAGLAAAGAAATDDRVGMDAADADYDHHAYDDQRLYASRRGVQGDVRDGEPRRLTLAEEQLNVGKRAVSAGEVELRKTVDTEHVRENVELMREEVTVERRPLSADAVVGAPTIGEDEIRIPVMEERLVVEKKLVPREEIIVRKRAVTDTQTVEGDVRRERLEVDDAAARAAGLVHDRTTGR